MPRIPDTDRGLFFVGLCSPTYALILRLLRCAYAIASPGAGLPAKRTTARALAGKSIHKENCRGIGNGGAGFIGGVAVAFLVAPRQDGPGF